MNLSPNLLLALCLRGLIGGTAGHAWGRRRRLVTVGVCTSEYDPNGGPPMVDPDFNDGRQARILT